MKKKFFVFFAIMALLVPSFALGATLKVGEEVIIGKDDRVSDNLYVAGGNVSLSAPILGDLFVAGGNVLSSGDVRDDIFAAGGSITILGNSGGDVRVAGGNILIVGDVEGELVVAGGSVVVSADTSVGKDLVVAGGQITVDGDILGDVMVAGGVATINGRVRGNVKTRIDSELKLGSSAVVDGNLEYNAPKEEALKLEEGAIVRGETTFNKVEGYKATKKASDKNFIFAFLGAFFVMKLLAFIIVALILLWLFKNFANSVVREAIGNPLRMLGMGLVYVIVTPIASIILLVTLFGIPLGLIGLMLYGILLTLSALYARVVFGAWVSKLWRKSPEVVVTWKNIIGGVILLALVGLIPFIGWIIDLFIFLVSAGSIASIAHKKLWQDR